MLAFAPRIFWLFLWMLYFTCRKKFEISKDLEHTNCIIIFWHGQFLMLPFAYLKLRKKPSIFVVTSRHFHGLLISRVCALFGFKTISGSTNHGGVDRGGARVLLEGIKKLKLGFDIGLTPDGPKGPYHSIANGVIALAQKTSVPLAPLCIHVQHCWALNSWDKFQIPKPFSKITYRLGDPFIIDTAMDKSDAKNLIYAKMSLV